MYGRSLWIIRAPYTYTFQEIRSTGEFHLIRLKRCQPCGVVLRKCIGPFLMPSNTRYTPEDTNKATKPCYQEPAKKEKPIPGCPIAWGRFHAAVKR